MLITRTPKTPISPAARTQVDGRRQAFPQRRPCVPTQPQNLGSQQGSLSTTGCPDARSIAQRRQTATVCRYSVPQLGHVRVGVAFMTHSLAQLVIITNYIRRLGSARNCNFDPAPINRRSRGGVEGLAGASLPALRRRQRPSLFRSGADSSFRM